MTSDNEFYRYNVNFGASIYHIVSFLIFACVQIGFCIYTHRKYTSQIQPAKLRRYVNVMIPLVTGVFLEAAGYICRMLSHTDLQQLGPYVVQSIVILVAPSFIQASIYMLFGELVKGLQAEHHCLIKLSYFTKLFVVGDVISIIIQCAGGGISVTSPKLGNSLATAGLFIQIAFFSTFMTCMINFMIKIHNERTNISQSLKSTYRKYGNWKHYMFVLFSSSILILIRSIYRVVEFLEGRDGELQSKETYFYVLDGMMIVITMLEFLTLNFPSALAKIEFTYGRHGNGDQESIILNDY